MLLFTVLTVVVMESTFEETLSTSDFVAIDPLERPAPVRVHVALFQKSVIKLPNEESVLPEYPQVAEAISFAERVDAAAAVTSKLLSSAKT